MKICKPGQKMVSRMLMGKEIILKLETILILLLDLIQICTTASADKKRRSKCGMFPVCLVSLTFKIYVQLKLSGGHHQGEDI